MRLKISRILCLLVILAEISLYTKAQGQAVILDADTVVVAPPDSTVQAVLQAADSVPQPKFKEIDMKPFKPNPTKAVLFSAILPGLGQIYNRAYWKLPIVYGGFMGCIYAVTWNNRNYKDYSTAYLDLMYDVDHNKDNPDAWSKSWVDIAKKNGREPSEFITNTRLQDNIKSRKDYFRRYRDLSIIITAGVYAICMIDAYVDAQLFDFDISPDLSMRIEPAVTPKTSFSERSYGLNCSIKF